MRSLGILMILVGLLFGFVALDWSWTPSTECGTKLAVQTENTEFGPAARQLEVAVVQLTEAVTAPGIVPFIGYSDSACRWIPRSMVGLFAFLCLGWGMLLLLSPGNKIKTRMERGLLAAIDRWRAAQKDRPGRPEAVRRLVTRALTTPPV